VSRIGRGVDSDDSLSVNPYRALTKRLLFPDEIKQSEFEGPSYILYPDGLLMTVWDMVSGACIIVQAVIVPVNLAFSSSDVVWSDIDIGMLIFFTLDILLSFNVAYYELGAIITNRRSIAINYLKGWCLPDVLATVPFDLILCSEQSCAGESSALVGFKFVRLTKALRLLRFAKLNKIMFMLEDFSSSQLLASSLLCLRLLFILFITTHWIACTWVFVGYLNILSADTWFKNAGLEDASMSEIYVTALYWTLTTTTSVGYGDVRTVDHNELYLAISLMFVSAVIFAYVLGSVTAFVLQQSAGEMLYRQQYLALSCFMKAKGLKPSLQGRARRYFEFIWERTQNNSFEDSVALPLLSKQLRKEIYSHTRGLVFSSCVTFAMHFAKQVTALSEQLKLQTYAPDDIIFTEGELSTALYFIQTGVVDVYHKLTSSSYKHLTDTAIFGEVAFFSNLPRTASVRSLNFTELFTLKRSKMVEVCEENLEALQQLELLEKSIHEGNLACIDVHCYVCSKPGHVAIHCTSIQVIKDQEKIAQNWIKNRSGKSKRVNLDRAYMQKFTRKEKKPLRPMYAPPIGKESPIKDKVDAFLQMVGEGDLKLETGEWVPPHFSLILNSDSDDIEVEERRDTTREVYKARSFKQTVCFR
jgi:CRP-like cAMP-binding protein